MEDFAGVTSTCCYTHILLASLQFFYLVLHFSVEALQMEAKGWHHDLQNRKSQHNNDY
ncbi:Uncharacterised protein [Serratia quinivorans]|nr:Uncharacterised protein [Serratia quinivorans]